MYKFIDTTEVSEEVTLPSEALRINGQYIENQIKGYKTLNVTGRESLSAELEHFETGVRDGSKLKSRRFPARVITVTYQLNAESCEAFREAFNQLANILNVEEVELIFNDEQDKFFIGTPQSIGSVPPGRNCVTGTFELLCLDPFKYSVEEYTAEPWDEDGSSILIDYKGTYKSFPTLQADFLQEEDVTEEDTDGVLTGTGDCGFVAFFNENEQIIQLGDPDEVDGEEAFEKSQVLVNQTFKTTSAWGTTAKKLWAVNAGTPKPSGVTVTETGTVGMGVESYRLPDDLTTKQTLLTTQSTSNSVSIAPIVKYTVSVHTNRTSATKCTLTFTISASIVTKNGYYDRSAVLRASIYVNGTWYTTVIKSTDSYWRSGSKSRNITVTYSGLTELETVIQNIRFKASHETGFGSVEAGVATTACSNINIKSYKATVADTYYMTATNFGSGSKYHGAAITRTIPADANGDVGAKDFILTYTQKMCIGNNSDSIKQYGDFHCYLHATDGTVVAGVRIVKNSVSKNASLMLFINGAKVHQVGIDMSYNNTMFGSSSKSVKTSNIRISGETVVFNIGGYKKEFLRDDIAELKVSKITYIFASYGTKPPLEFNGLMTAKFTKHNCETWNDIPNKFTASDVVVADCSEGKVYLNGIETPELGALGNDWENFYLSPGTNQIGFSYSDWVEAGSEPKMKVRYREVFL